MGHDVHFIGWDRRPDEPKVVDLGATTVHNLVKAGHVGRIALLGRLRFAWHIWNTVAKLRPDIVWAVNEDNAFSLLPLKGLFYRGLVCDVYDALVDRHSHRSWPMRMLLRAVSWFSRVGADHLIATDEARYRCFGHFSHKTSIVCNYPEQPMGEPWRRQPDGRAKVYVTGALVAGRGLAQILQAAVRLGNVDIVSTGWLNDGYSRDIFAAHPNVTYRGVVSPSESLELAAQCDAVFAFYRLDSTNNRMASPNKVYDAMCVGRPVIINSETGVSEWVMDEELGYSCGYDDVAGLTGILASLPERRPHLPHFAKHARRASATHTWEQMIPRLSHVCARLEPVETVQPVTPIPVPQPLAGK